MTPDVPILCRNYLPTDLMPSLQKHGIERTVLVQTAQSVSETDFLLGLANACDFIGGVVGWLEMDSPGFATQFELYSHIRKFIGLRPMLQDISNDDWILRPQVIESLKLLAEHEFPFDFLTYTRHLPYVVKVLEKVPNLRAVMDHLSKPEIKDHKMDPWKNLMAEIAQHPNVYCKLSGMVTEANHDSWTPNDLSPYVEHVADCFGLDRVMYGSDWPVCTLAGSYGQVISALKTILKPRLDANTESAVFGDNAARFYKIQ